MSYGANERKLLLNFSETQERASLINTDIEEDSMARKRKGRKGRKGKRSLKGIKRKGVRLNKGRIALRVAGYQGLQSFLCCFFWVLNSAKDLTPYLYPELKLFTVKTF